MSEATYAGIPLEICRQAVKVSSMLKRIGGDPDLLKMARVAQYLGCQALYEYLQETNDVAAVLEGMQRYVGGSLPDGEHDEIGDVYE